MCEALETMEYIVNFQQDNYKVVKSTIPEHVAVANYMFKLDTTKELVDANRIGEIWKSKNNPGWIRESKYDLPFSRIKLPRGQTLFVWQTKIVLIIGAETLDLLSEAYTIIMQFFIEHECELFV